VRLMKRLDDARMVAHPLARAVERRAAQAEGGRVAERVVEPEPAAAVPAPA